MAHYQNQISSGGWTATHLISWTRSSVLSARSAGTLIPWVSYEITDHVQGRLVAGTTVTILATSPTEVWQVATVNTTYDDQSWFGIYDIDLAQVIELHDGRNNIAITANAVSLFDWWNSAYTNCRIETSNFTVTYGSTRPVNNLVLRNGCIFNAVGWSSGVINDVELKNSSSLSLINASVSLVRFELDATTLNFLNYTGNNTITKWKLTQSSVNCSNSSIQVTLSFVEANNWTLNRTGFTSGGTLAWAWLTVEQTANITHQNWAGAMTLNRVHLWQNSSINHSLATVTITDSIIDGWSTISKTAWTGTITMSQSVMEMSSLLSVPSNVNVSLTRHKFLQSSTLQLASGSSGNLTMSDCEMEWASYVSYLATATGNLNISTTVFAGNSFLQKSSTSPTNTVTQSMFLGSSRIIYSGTRPTAVNRLNASEIWSITFGGTGTVTDAIDDVRVWSRGQINMNGNGTQANTVRYSSVSGLSWVINIIGTSGWQSIQRATADNGAISLNNDTIAMTHDMLSARQNGSITVNNMALAKSISYIDVSTGALFNMTSATAAGSITRVNVRTNGQVNVSGTAGSVTAVECSEWVVAINGGAAHQNITKTMSSTLTTGNFTTSNIAHHDTTSKTLTANNTARANYLGVTSTLPLI